MSSPEKPANNPDDTAVEGVRRPRKAYVKPAFEREQLFETMALACGKINPFHRGMQGCQEELLTAVPTLVGEVLRQHGELRLARPWRQHVSGHPIGRCPLDPSCDRRIDRAGRHRAAVGRRSSVRASSGPEALCAWYPGLDHTRRCPPAQRSPTPSLDTTRSGRRRDAKWPASPGPVSGAARRSRLRRRRHRMANTSCRTFASARTRATTGSGYLAW